MRADASGVGQEDERRREPVALARENREVEVVQRHDEPDVVLLAQRGQRRDVRGSAMRGTITWRSQW